MMPFVFYDTETTGTETSFDQILQFAAVCTDDHFEERDQVNVRCRRLPYVVPSPGALLVTGISLETLEHEDLSHYEMTREVNAWLRDKTPAIFLGYNSIRFDETLLRQALYQTLQPAYLTNTNGNCRGDVMYIAQAAAVYAPDSIAVPRDERDRYVFRLGDLIRENGIEFGEDQAHEALADVRATIQLAQHVKHNAPAVWSAMINNTQKGNVNDFIEQNEVFCLTNFYFGRPFSHVVTQAGRNAENSSEIAVFDLAEDPEEYLAKDIDELLAVLNRSPKVIRSIRANAHPIIMPFDMIPDEIRGARHDDATYLERARLIQEDDGFQHRLGQALARRYEDVEPSPYVEGKIYDGFASADDQGRMERFHRRPWQERYELCDELDDERFAELGRRLIYVEQPDALPDAMRARLDHWVADRMLTDADVPWTTIPKALQEVDDLRGRGLEDEQVLDEIRRFLLSLGDHHAPT